jgi:1,2-phenylacetyl-CoA epoxidase catalytic subunit
MAAFALDQAATAALVALATTLDERAVALAHRIVDEEESHRTFALEAFRALIREDPGQGLPLAREMIVDRDWVKQVFPRRAQLVSLADAGLLAADAPRAHDSFLASLGDRIQDALGVLGDL